MDDKTGSRDATTYYNELMILWQELDLFEMDEWESSKDNTQYGEKKKSRVFVFLDGLDKELEEVRYRILCRNPLPNIREVFSEVRREEARCHVMLPKSIDLSIGVESYAMVSKNNKPL